MIGNSPLACSPNPSRLALVLLVACASHTLAAGLGPPKDVWDPQVQASLFTGRVLACPAPEDVTLAAWDFDREGTWPRSHIDPKVQGLRVESGALRFQLGARRVSLGWGSFGQGWDRSGRSRLKIISFRGNQIAGAFINVRMRHSKPTSRWRVEFCYRGDPRDTGLMPGRKQWGLGDLAASPRGDTTDWQTLTFPCCQLAAADGLGIEVEGPPGCEIAIDSVRIVQHLWDTYARKVIAVPEGPIFSAKATVAANTNVWVNGKLLHEEAVAAATSRYILVGVDLGPHLKPGRNVVAVSEVCRMKHTPICWMQGAVQMASGQTIRLDTGLDWKANVRAEAGWLGPDFDDSSWLSPGKSDPTGYLRGMRPYTKYHPGRLPTYCGQVEIENPYQKKLFYDAEQPVRFEVRLPAGLAHKRPRVQYEVWDYRTSKLAAEGSAATGQPDGDAVRYDISPGKLPRGVYTLLLDAGAGLEPQLTRQETFMVVGRIPMPDTDGRTWDHGMKLELVDEIDCTNPDDPHPFRDGGMFKPDYASRVVTRGSLKYRESPASRGNQHSWFGYKFKFRSPNRPHWVVIDYPDDAPRLLEAQVLPLYPRPATKGRYACETSWAAPGAQVGGAYPNTGKMQPLRLVVWSHEVDAAVMLTSAGQGSAGPAAARIRVYEIEQLPALAVRGRGRRFGLFTERASVLDRTYGGGPLLEPRGRNPYVAWFDEAERYAQYCRFTGQNAHFMGCYQYTYGNPPAVVPDTGAEGCALLPSLRDVFINVLGANGIATYSALEYRTDPRDWHKAWPALHQVAQSGADLMFQVDKDGRCAGGHYQRDNPMASPAALRSMTRNVGHIVNRFSIYPAWKGLVFLLAPKWEGPVYDSADVSFDDQTIRLFEKETGQRVQVVVSDPDRFRKRHALLVGEPRRRPETALTRAWFDWRSEKLAQVHDTLAHMLRSRRSDAEYMVIVEYPVEQVYGKLRRPLLEMMRDVGYDPRTYARRKGCYFGRDVWSFAPLADGRAIGWPEWMRDPEAVRLMNEGAGDGRALLVRWGFDEWIAAPLVRGEAAVWPGGYWINHGTPGHRYLPERFTLALIDSDVDRLMYGFCDCNATVGGEHEMRRFVREFVSLPDARFTRLTGNGLDRNVAVKEAEAERDYYIYIANPGWWDCDVNVTVRGQGRGPILRTVDGAEVALADQGEAKTLRLKLPPYGVAAFTGPEPALKPLRANVLVPAEARSYIERKLAECQARARDAKADAADMKYVNHQLSLAAAAAERTDWAEAWQHVALAAFSQAGQRVRSAAGTGAHALP